MNDSPLLSTERCAACGRLRPGTTARGKPGLYDAETDAGAPLRLCGECLWARRPGVEGWRLVALGRVLMGGPAAKADVLGRDVAIPLARPVMAVDEMVAAFVRDRCVVNPWARVRAVDLFAAWIEHNGGSGGQSRRVLYSALIRGGFQHRQRGGQMWVEGLRLSDGKADPREATFVPLSEPTNGR